MNEIENKEIKDVKDEKDVIVIEDVKYKFTPSKLGSLKYLVINPETEKEELKTFTGNRADRRRFIKLNKMKKIGSK